MWGGRDGGWNGGNSGLRGAGRISREGGPGVNKGNGQSVSLTRFFSLMIFLTLM